MNMMKGLLLGSAAGFVAIAGAQAADLPVKAKPVEYVKICSTYGVGFYYIPGTDSCVRISGYFREDISANSQSGAIERVGAIPAMQRSRDYYDLVTRGSFSFDVRNNTQYGVMRAYFNEYITTDTQKAVTPSLSSAYLQLAGFTVGRFIETYATAWDTDIGSYTTNSYTARDTSQASGLEYRAQFGGGVSAAIGVFEPRRYGLYDRADTQMNIGSFATSQPLEQAAGDNATHMPDIQGDVRVEQAWGGFHVGAVLHEDNVTYNGANQSITPSTGFEATGAPKTKYGYALNASLNLTQLPTGKGDKFTVSAQYTKGAIAYLQGSAAAAPSWAVFGPGNNSGFYNSVAFGYILDSVFDSSGALDGGAQHLTTAWSVNAGFEHYWLPAVLRSSLYGHFQKVSYDAVAKQIICTTTAGASRFGFTASSGVCDPNFSSFVVGSRTAWNITPDLEVSGDVMYNQYNTASSGFLTANTTMFAGKPQLTNYNIKNQGQFGFFSRIQRSW